MRFSIPVTLATVLFVPFVSSRNQASPPASERAIAQPLSESILGNWRGVLILNDPDHNFARIPAHLRFTGSVVYLDREAIEVRYLGAPRLRDWRADYEVVGSSSIYLNPHHAPEGPTLSSAPFVIGDVTIVDDRLEAVVRRVTGSDLDHPFGWAFIAAGIRMQRE
jgi:hypothetical protein